MTSCWSTFVGPCPIANGQGLLMRCPAWSSLRTAYSNPLQRESLLAGQIPVTASVERLGPSSYSPGRVEDFRGFSGLDRFLTLREDWMTGNPGGSVSGVDEHALPLSEAIFCAPSCFATHSKTPLRHVLLQNEALPALCTFNPWRVFLQNTVSRRPSVICFSMSVLGNKKHAMACTQALALQLPCN